MYSSVWFLTSNVTHNSPYRSETESIDNDFHSLTFNMYSGVYLNFRPDVDWVV